MVQIQKEKPSYLSKLSKHIGRRMSIILLCLCIASSSCVLSGVSFFTHIVHLDDDGNQSTFYTIKNNPLEILEDHSLSLHPQDEYTSSESDHIIDIQIHRAVELSILEQDRTTPLTLRPSSTVQEALTAANLSLNEQDVVTPAPIEKVANHMVIQITRIDTQQRTTEEAIPYTSTSLPTEDLPKGTTKVQTAGQNGVLTHYFEDTMVDGEHVQSVEVGSKITVEPVQEVVLVGTYQPPIQKAAQGSGKSTLGSPIALNDNGVPATYSRVLTGRACAYTSAPGAKTSTGKTVQPGLVAVNPNVIPYGTKMYILSTDGYVYGYSIASDTGGSCMKGDILVDLYMSSMQDCKAFGSRQVNIYFV